MKAIYKAPGEAPEAIEIENSLESLQQKVGGYIEVVPFATNACVICNEDGRILGLRYNLKLLGVDFVGPIIIVGVDGDDFCDLEAIEYMLSVIEQHPTTGKQRFIEWELEQNPKAMDRLRTGYLIDAGVLRHAICNVDCPEGVPEKDFWAVLEEVARTVQALPPKVTLQAPCDLCRYSPPSSGDGKPCTLCPASAAEVDG